MRVKVESSIKIESSNVAGAAGAHQTTSISTTTFVDYDELPGKENRQLVQQILELRRRLDDDHQNYKKKLQHYEDSQQKQAELVAKLQQKVLQYKSKCSELEMTVESKNLEMECLRVRDCLLHLFIFLLDVFFNACQQFRRCCRISRTCMRRARVPTNSNTIWSR